MPIVDWTMSTGEYIGRMKELDLNVKIGLDKPIPHNDGAIGRPSLYQRLLSNDYLRNNILVLAGSFVGGVCNLLLHPVLSRQLGPIGYGTVASLLNLLGILLLPVQFISTVVVKYSSSLSAGGQLAQLNDLVRRLTAILLPIGAVITVILIAANKFFATSLRLPQQGIVFLAITFLVAFVSQVNGGALQGLQRFGWVSSLNVLATVTRLILASALVFLGFGVNGAILGVVLSVVFGYLISFLPLRHLLSGARSPSGSLRSLWSYSITAIIASGSITLLMNVDTIMAKAYLPGTEAGLYAALATAGKLVLFISSSIVVVMLPKVAALHQRDENTTQVVLQSLLGMLVLSAGAEFIFLVVPSLVIRYMFGYKFVAVSGQLAWYGLAMLMFALAQPLGTYFLAIGNRLYGFVVLACCAIQGVLIVLRHGTLIQIVQAVIVSHTLLFVLLVGLFVLYDSPRGRRLRTATA